MSDRIDIDPAQLDAMQRYKLLIGGILPRPIALVSTISPHGVTNLAPFSFFTGVGSDPMLLLFCPANRPDGGEKDSLRNARPVAEGGTGHFVINVVPACIARRMAACAEELPYEQSEFDLSGLTPAPSVAVRAPGVAESPVSFECITRQVIRTNPGKPAGGNIVLGEVVRIGARKGVIDSMFHVEHSMLDLVGRIGGRGYITTRERFELPVGAAALRATAGVDLRENA